MNKTLPDFLIIGAAKSGTSSLHLILDKHPDIYIPDQEIFYFDQDDSDQHGDFFTPSNGKNGVPKFEGNLKTYSRNFRDAEKNQTIGEDSTTYLASRKAPKRIKQHLPEVKLLVLLRDPIERTYSQYWHSITTGRTSQTFEKFLKNDLYSLVNRGHYQNQLERYLIHFPRSQIKVIIFERFVQDMKTVISEVITFLEIDKDLDLSDINTHHNPTSYPRSHRLQRIINKIVGPISPHGNIPKNAKNSSLPGRILRKIFRNLNLSKHVDRPKMKPHIREFLKTYFNHENKGILKLINKNLKKYWPWFDG